MEKSSHIVPVRDMAEHVMKAGTCWCVPRHDPETNRWVHNSMDRREDYELGIRKPH
jgi:hypothetical protein